MSKRRKRRRLAFINRLTEVFNENPGISLEAAKQLTEKDVRKALRRADHLTTDREEHQRIFEETLSSSSKVKEETTTQPTLTKVEPAPEPEKKLDKAEVVAKANKAIAKPKTTTKKATAKKATTTKKPATAKKSTTTKKTTTRKRTTTTKTKKS